MSTQEAYVLLTAIQQKIASAVGDFTKAIDQKAKPASDQPSLLLNLINSATDIQDLSHADLAKLLDALGLDGLVKAVGGAVPSGQTGTKQGLPDLRDIGGFFKNLNLDDLKDFGERLLAGNPLDAVKNQIDTLRAGLGGSSVQDAVHGIVGRQIGIGISFITTLKNLGTRQLPEQVVQGWMKYFFGEGGYTTLDGIQIASPGRPELKLSPSDLAGLQQGLKGLLNERSAEQYVRDLVRIVVEVGGDLRYGLPARLDLLKGKVPDDKNKAKAARWFSGAGSMAESLVTSAVEELSLGVAQFQTNAVLAAAAATYAGTAARKAAQHAFLGEAGV